MFGVPSFGQNPFGSVPTYNTIVPSPQSPSIVVMVAAALKTAAALRDSRLRVTPTLPETDFT